MILLQILLNSEDIAVILFAFLINAIIFYFLVKAAVKDALKQQLYELKDQLKMLNRFKLFELKKAGAGNEELQKEIDIIFPKPNQ